MTKTVRTILLLSLVILFLIVAPLTILYSLGWRFDWETKKIIQPGVFYFKTWPKNARIYLNTEFKKKTDFFFGSALIENLPPKQYAVEIRKQGFHSWRKTLEIKKRQVTETKNITLIPENPNFTIISQGIENFYFSPDNKKIISKERINTNPENPENPSWALKLFDLEKNVKSHLIEEKDISSKQVQLIDLKFSPDSKKILLEVGIEEKPIYFLLEIDRTPAVLTPLDFLDRDIREIYFIPRDSQKLLILFSFDEDKGKVRKLSEVDLMNKKISSPYLENIITCSVLKDNIYCLDNLGFVFRTDFSFSSEEKLNTTPLSLRVETEYKISGINSHIFLKEGNVLYFFNKDKKIFKKLFEPVKNLRFSPNSKKIVYFNNYEIWILFLEQTYDQPQKGAGEQVFLTRFSEKIDEVFWYTNHYLVFNVGDKIKIAEIDDRDKINIVNFVEFPSSKEDKTSKIFWNQDNKKLYILSEKILYTSKKLVP